MTGVAVLQVTHLLAGVHIKDLSTAVATSGNVASIVAESDTAHYTLMRKIVHKVYFEPATLARVVNSMPVFTLTLQMGW